MNKNGVRICDFCYTPQVIWEAKLDNIDSVRVWEFEICDSCRILLREVIGPALHRISHEQMVIAITELMKALGITYDDLMKPLFEIVSGRKELES